MIKTPERHSTFHVKTITGKLENDTFNRYRIFYGYTRRHWERPITYRKLTVHGLGYSRDSDWVELVYDFKKGTQYTVSMGDK